MTQKTLRIGLWGGSFNPPTLAHMALAEFAVKTLNLDELLWVVSPHNPEKDPATLAPFDSRFAMVGQILQDNPHMTVSDIEHRNGSSWTIDTVKAMRERYPDAALFWMMGTDNWLGFHGWGEGFDRILDYVSILVLQRPGLDLATTAVSSELFRDKQVANPLDMGKAGNWCIVDNPLWDMSATRIREALQQGREPEGIDPQTLAYLRAHGLYSS